MRRKGKMGMGVSLVQAALFASHGNHPFFMNQVRIFDTKWPSLELVAASAFLEESLIPAIRPARALASTLAGVRAPRDHTPND